MAVYLQQVCSACKLSPLVLPGNPRVERPAREYAKGAHHPFLVPGLPGQERALPLPNGPSTRVLLSILPRLPQYRLPVGVAAAAARANKTNARSAARYRPQPPSKLICSRWVAKRVSHVEYVAPRGWGRNTGGDTPIGRAPSRGSVLVWPPHGWAAPYGRACPWQWGQWRVGAGGGAFGNARSHRWQWRRVGIAGPGAAAVRWNSSAGIFKLR